MNLWAIARWLILLLWVNLCRLCLGALVYHLWKLKNDLCHGNFSELKRFW
jgi:hypothetical protein